AGVARGEHDGVAEFDDGLALGGLRLGAALDARVDVVGEGCAQLLLEVGALAIGHAAHDGGDVAVGESAGGHGWSSRVSNAVSMVRHSALSSSARRAPSSLVR